MLVILLLLFGVVAGSGNSSTASFNTEYFFQKARIFMSEGKYLEAMGFYQTIADTSADPEEKAQALLMIGVSYAFYLDQPDKALQYFDYICQAYSTTSAAAEALFRKGVVFYKEEKYPEAYQFFTDYLAVFPDGRQRQSATVWAESALNLAAADTRSRPLRRSRIPYSPHTLIRVLLAEDQKTVIISAVGGLKIDGLPLQQSERETVGKVVFSASGGTLLVNGRDLDRDCCRVSAPERYLRLHNTRYRGYFTVSANGRRLSVINQVPLEHYLYGVVSREVPCDWPMQALMAQAVAARTYALYMKHCREENAYDVAATTASQVYGGYDAEKFRTTLAVDKTCGEIMTHNGGLVVAYFHSNSGGYTENPLYVWGVEVPYLRAQPDQFSINSSGDSWQYFLSYADARQKLQDYGFNSGRIKRFQFEEKTCSGRFGKVRVVSDKGNRTINSNQFRLAIGATRLKSTCFQPESNETGVLFTGQGYGHGVGMSQWGARKMALGGHDYKSILRHYYTDIMIVSMVD